MVAGEIPGKFADGFENLILKTTGRCSGLHWTINWPSGLFTGILILMLTLILSGWTPSPSSPGSERAGKGDIEHAQVPTSK